MEKEEKKNGNRVEYINTLLLSSLVEKECITVDCLLNRVGKLNIYIICILLYNKIHFCEEEKKTN